MYRVTWLVLNVGIRFYRQDVYIRNQCTVVLIFTSTKSRLGSGVIYFLLVVVVEYT